MTNPNVVTQVNEQFISGTRAQRTAIDQTHVPENQGFFETDTAEPRDSNLWIHRDGAWHAVGAAPPPAATAIFMKFSGVIEAPLTEQSIATVFLSDSLDSALNGSSTTGLGYPALAAATKAVMAVQPIANSSSVDMNVDLLVNGTPVGGYVIPAGSTTQLPAAQIAAGAGLISLNDSLDVRVSPAAPDGTLRDPFQLSVTLILS